jgi:4-hydroxybenzoyl-CoA reductase subunit beta
MTASLSDFHLLQPLTIQEAIAARLDHPNARFVAGGTDLLVNMRRGISNPNSLIDLSAIDELAEIDLREDGVTIGAGVTIATLARHECIADRYKALSQAAQAIAGPAHRAMATVGGNLCLDTRCIYYNQSEWWRSANAYCLKNRGDICHVAPQGRRCHAAITGELAPALLV